MADKKILIADDDVSLVMLLRGKFEEGGYEVEEVYTGTDAHSRVLENEYQLIILDYDIPGMKGHEVCQEIRSHEHLKNLPVIIITAHQNHGEDFFKDEGATDVVYKPIDYDELLPKVERHLQQS